MPCSIGWASGSTRRPRTARIDQRGADDVHRSLGRDGELARHLRGRLGRHLQPLGGAVAGGGDPGAGPTPRLDQPRGLEFAVGACDRVDGQAQVVGETAHGRQAGAHHERAVGDLRREL